MWLSQAPPDAAHWPEVFPGFLLIGIGTGFAAMASEVAAFIGVEEEVSGLAGGMIETSREVGGALGVAIIATVAFSRTDDVMASLGGGAENLPTALTAGFERGSLVAAGFALVGAVAAALVLRPAEKAAMAALRRRRRSTKPCEPTTTITLNGVAMIQRFDSAEVAGAKSPPPHCRTMDVMASDANPLGSYGQLCPVAAGTDAVADRWTLLLLRDLAHTPLRFTELQAANPRISPSVLTKRLLRLEEDGLIETITAERTAQKRYQIRDAVRSPILAVLDAVSKLGFALTPEGDVTAEQLVAQLETDRAWFLAKHHRTEGSFAMHIDDASIGLVVSQFSLNPASPCLMDQQPS